MAWEAVAAALVGVLPAEAIAVLRLPPTQLVSAVGEELGSRIARAGIVLPEPAARDLDDRVAATIETLSARPSDLPLSDADAVFRFLDRTGPDDSDRDRRAVLAVACAQLADLAQDDSGTDTDLWVDLGDAVLRVAELGRDLGLTTRLGLGEPHDRWLARRLASARLRAAVTDDLADIFTGLQPGADRLAPRVVQSAVQVATAVFRRHPTSLAMTEALARRGDRLAAHDLVELAGHGDWSARTALARLRTIRTGSEIALPDLRRRADTDEIVGRQELAAYLLARGDEIALDELSTRAETGDEVAGDALQWLMQSPSPTVDAAGPPDATGFDTGWAQWSGTSFAAPRIAAGIARHVAIGRIASTLSTSHSPRVAVPGLLTTESLYGAALASPYLRSPHTELEPSLSPVVDCVLLSASAEVDKLVNAFDAGPHRGQTGLDPVPDRPRIEIGRGSADPTTKVNLGLTPGEDPYSTEGLRRLEAGSDTWLWVELGPPARGALPGGSRIRTELLPAGAIIDVVLVVDEGLRLRQATTGAFRLNGTAGPMPVAAAADSPPEPRPLELANRLYFQLTAVTPGSHRLRCCLYVANLLVHVEEVDIAVGPDAPERDVRTAFRLTSDLSALGRTPVTPHRLSVYLNGDGDTHSVSFRAAEGQTETQHQATLQASAVDALIGMADKALHTASWGASTPAPPSSSAYRYEPAATDAADFAGVEKLETDLCRLALAGRAIWNDLTTRLTQTRREQVDLRQAMRTPGLIQLALRSQADQLLPLSSCYDLALDTSLAVKKLRLCGPARAYFASPAPRPAELPCADGCPDAEQAPARDVVCPMGFWGFRHTISVTLDNPDALDAAAPEFGPVGGLQPSVLAGLTRDPRVTERAEKHLSTLRGLFTLDTRYDVADVRDGLISGCPDLIYFLCHVRDDTAGAVVVVGGVDDKGPGIDTSALLDWDLASLRRAHPPVFINACHSIAPAPGRLISLADTLFRLGASATIGTTITVFVSLAVPLAESLLTQIRAGRPIPAALHRARLDLLSRRNPLGLAYITFGVSR